MFKSLRLFSFCAILYLISNVISFPSSTAPLLLWSNTNFLSGVNKQIVDILDVSNAEGSFQDTKEYFFNAVPELLIVFVEPQLTSEKLSLLTDSHIPQSNGGSFSNLKRLVENSKSSIVYPYVTTSDFNTVATSLITSLMRNLQETASIVVAGDTTSSMKIFRGKAVTSYSLEQLKEKLALNKDWNLLTNGITDLLVIKFNSPSFNLADEANLQKIYATDDQLLSTIDAILNDISYVAMFTSDSSSIHSTVETSFPQSHPVLTRFEKRFQQTVDDSNWPDAIVQALLVSIPLLIILSIGLVCTFSVQSDLKFDAEKVMKNRQ